MNDEIGTAQNARRYTVAVIGGTGPQGKGLGYRFARHGHDVVLGSRTVEKAEAVAAEVAERLAVVGGTGTAWDATNADAVAEADVVLLAVPYDGLHGRADLDQPQVQDALRNPGPGPRHAPLTEFRSFAGW